MLTLFTLKDLVRAKHPGAESSLTELLLEWFEQDPEKELSKLLRGTGTTREALCEQLKPLRTDPVAQQKNLISSCVLAVRHGPILSIHLLLELCKQRESPIGRAFGKEGLLFDRLKKNIDEELQHSNSLPASPSVGSNTSTNALLRYGRDLTARAEAGAFDSLCERPVDLERILNVLLRKNKENAVLTGPAGVGKTALVELFARSLLGPDTPEPLRGSRVFELSMTKIVAGTRYRGDFEDRMHALVAAALNHRQCILFVDEIHLIWGAGSAENVHTDAANILKPFLARGSLRMIGATTVEEYHCTIVQDAALARRFQELRINDPDEVLTARMVRHQAESLAGHHDVVFCEGVIEQAIALTNRHLPNRHQPDKAVDLLDSASVSVRRAARNEVTSEDLMDTLARLTTLPLATIRGDERNALMGLSEELGKRIIGQDEAIRKVVETFIYRRQGLSREQRSLGSFLFAGETGVGKSELARVVADIFFGKPSALLRIDLAEYKEAGSVSKLVGPAPGYIDSERAGHLSEWVRTEGSGVILFDEAEKAHPDVRNWMLGLLDTGLIRSPRGETLDCRQCVIILTTNALRSSDYLGGRIGFVQQELADPTTLLSEQFPLEFLSRLDEVILFRPLGEDELRRIVALRIREAFERLAKKGVRVHCSEERLVEHFSTALRRSRSGARGIDRIIETELLQPLSIVFLRADEGKGYELALDEEFYSNGRISIKQNDP